MKRIGFYAGSFDPPTRGHKWMIETALTMCDQLYVGVGIHPTKKATFTSIERGKLIYSMLDEGIAGRAVQTVLYPGATVLEAMAWKATMMFRGIRSVSDFDYELMQRYVNDDIAKHDGVPPVTVFLAPPPELSMVSSSMVKSLVGLPNWDILIHKYVTSDIVDALREKHAEKNV